MFEGSNEEYLDNIFCWIQRLFYTSIGKLVTGKGHIKWTDGAQTVSIKSTMNKMFKHSSYNLFNTDRTSD